MAQNSLIRRAKYLAVVLAIFGHSKCLAQTTIGLGSCNNKADEQIFKSINDKKTDFFLFLGDNIYLRSRHISSKKKILERYESTYSEAQAKLLVGKTGTFAIWDDHDFGLNNSDSKHKEKANSLEAFQTFWKPPPPPDNLRKSIAFSKNLTEEILLIATDNRSYRINPGSNEAPTVFGEKQLKWIEREISSSKAKLILLAMGGQFLSTTEYPESFTHYPKDKKFILEAFSRTETPVVILSGDRHYSEILKDKYKGKTIWEVTSSPLTAGVKKSHKLEKDKRQLVQYHQGNSFSILEVDLKENQVSIHAKIYSREGKLVAKTELKF